MDDFYSINLNQIQQNKIERDRLKYHTYKVILQKCYLLIKNCSDNDSTFCVFQIPEYILGHPLFKKDNCAKYVIQHLNENGFNAEYIKPNHIVIKWDFVEDSMYSGFRKTIEKPIASINDFRHNHLLENKPITSFNNFSPLNNFNNNQRRDNFSISIHNKNETPDKFKMVTDYVPTKSIYFGK